MRPEEILQSIPTAMTDENGMARNEDLLAFQRNFKGEPEPWRRILYRFLATCEGGWYRLRRNLQRLRGKDGAKVHLNPFVERRALHLPLLGSTAFHWAADRLVKDYQQRLNRS